MSFLDDLKLAGLQSFRDALNDPGFRGRITPEALTPQVAGFIPPPPGSAAVGRGWSGVLNTAADFYSDAAQRTINGILSSGTDTGPLVPGQNGSFTGGQCEGVYYIVTLTVTNNANGTSVTTTRGVNGPVVGLENVDSPNGNKTINLIGTYSNGEREIIFITASGAEPHPSAAIDSVDRSDGQPDNCGNPPLYGDPNGSSPSGPNPDHPVNPGGNHPGNMRFGAPYLGNDGNLHVPFNVSGDGWALGGSFNPATGEWDFGPPLAEDEFGNPIGDPARHNASAGGDGDGDGGDGSEDECDCVELERKVGEIYNRLGCEDNYPLSLPENIAKESSAQAEINTVPELLVYTVRQIDAIAGQFPIRIKLTDTDPSTEGNQTETVVFPNQAEMMAEMFGVTYESNLNLQTLVLMMMRLVPEVIASKNSSIVSQDFLTTIAEYMGMRTEDKSIKVPCNFNPARADSLNKLMTESDQYLKGIKDADPHTMVEWLQKIATYSQIAAAPHFRGKDQMEELTEEIKSFAEEPGEKSEADWEKFIDNMNSQFSPFNRTPNANRPRVFTLENLDDQNAPIPQP